MSNNIKNKDDLTGLMDYQAFLKSFDEEIVAANVEGWTLSLAFVDINHFMKINEDFGQKAGDEVLKALSGHLKTSASSSGSIYRYGGDEFAILLPNMEKEEAFLLLEKIRSSVCLWQFVAD